jgi:ribonucleoside-diphosphate reductase alpha chain
MSRKQQPKLARGELRRMLPNRQAMTRKLRLGDLEGYVIVGLYEDGTPGEVFLTFDRVGSMERGLLNALALVISKALQRGVPLADIVKSMRGQKFEPSGFTGDKEIPSADSIVDLIAQWLELRFVKGKM